MEDRVKRIANKHVKTQKVSFNVTNGRIGSSGRQQLKVNKRDASHSVPILLSRFISHKGANKETLVFRH